ncbi:MAG: transposase [Candidatus Micrarchaeaceae archaeon]
MRVVKSVIQIYQPVSELLSLMEIFKEMVNDCIKTGLENNITSLKSLSNKSYHILEKYDALSYYKLTAISSAVGILRNYRKAQRKNKETKRPYLRKLKLVSCYGLKIESGNLVIPTTKEPIIIPLNGHTKRTLSGYTIRSFSLTPRTASICYAKNINQIKPTGVIGIDRNLNNVTCVDNKLNKNIYKFDKITIMKREYKETKSHLKRNDYRIRTLIYTKYGRRQKRRTVQIFHNASKKIVENAKETNSAIVMERLTGIRKLYKKGNGQGKNYRFTLNSWSFAELQRQIKYKADWEGIPVLYVNPRGTSSNCSKCGSRVIEWADRMVSCNNCGMALDRDVNAAMNIMLKGASWLDADGISKEAMNRNIMTQAMICRVNPQRR